MFTRHHPQPHQVRPWPHIFIIYIYTHIHLSIYIYIFVFRHFYAYRYVWAPIKSGRRHISLSIYRSIDLYIYVFYAYTYVWAPAPNQRWRHLQSETVFMFSRHHPQPHQAGPWPYISIYRSIYLSIYLFV